MDQFVDLLLFELAVEDVVIGLRPVEGRLHVFENRESAAVGFLPIPQLGFAGSAQPVRQVGAAIDEGSGRQTDTAPANDINDLRSKVGKVRSR